MKIFNIFLIFAQNIDCRYTLGGSNEYPQSMFWSKNKKNVYPCKSNRKSMNRNWSNQKANPALKTKAGNK